VRRLILVLATIGVAVLLASGAALGITNGNSDNGQHPYVGALVEFPKRGNPYPYCSGTLISPTVFLTAAHCGDNGERVKVTFKEKDFTSTLRTNAGTFHADPNGNDIAVVTLDTKAVDDNDHEITTLAQLPSLNRLELSDVGKGEKTYNKFTAVGYGGQEPVKRPGGPVIVYNDEREWAISAYKSVNRTYLSLSQNLNQGNGGTCYGDSGGPNFFGAGTAETNVIAGITITGDTWCKATNVTLRLDTKGTETPRAFLRQYEDKGVTLPPENPPVPSLVP
jgi:secreted trypsin-like serine protease